MNLAWTSLEGKEGVEMTNRGGGSGEGALGIVLPVVDTGKTEPQQVVSTRIVRMAAEKFDCRGCHLPLKPPIFKCDANHLVCSSCRGAHGEACGRPVMHSTLADDFAAAVFVPCDYERYGCNVGGVIYHAAADHRRVCQHAPCGCPGRCGFSGSLQNLLKHIPEHSRAILVVRYGHPGALSLPLSQGWQVLVGEDDNSAADRHRNVFLVSVAERGGAEEVEVSLVCVRADGGVAPQFSCVIAVEHSDDGTRTTLEAPVVKSSSLCSGAPPAPGEVMKCLTVKKDYLSGDSVPVTFRIDRLAQPPPFTPNRSRPFSPKPPPFSPTQGPFSPKQPPPFSPTQGPFSPKQPPPFSPTQGPFSPMSPPFSPKPPPFSPKSLPFSNARPFSPKPSPNRPFSPKPTPNKRPFSPMMSPSAAAASAPPPSAAEEKGTPSDPNQLTRIYLDSDVP